MNKTGFDNINRFDGGEQDEFATECHTQRGAQHGKRRGA
jgi:hypothetical protein